ncbi:helix-turn-helix domain-containing protein [Nocardiopsis synnemataformans]|uniref:helix-turn-helix domain-containing protein n=1 Tax=Nocardiopsis synnemataformans TaxID=61305 RepID=UPI003EB6CE29
MTETLGPASGLSAAVGERVKQDRLQRGWSQSELAQRVCRLNTRMHQSQISKIESGTNLVIVEHLYLLATALEVPMTDLLGVTATEVHPLPPADEQIAERLEAKADAYPEYLFPEDGTSPEALVAAAMRHAYRDAAQTARGQGQ